MNVLCHGRAFCCLDSPVVDLYRGPHDVRILGTDPASDFTYDPRTETAPRVIDRIAQTWKPDLLLCWLPEMAPPPLGIEHAPVKTVALVSDWNVYYAVLHRNLGRYDLVLCDKPGTRVLRNGLVEPHYLFPLYSQVSPVHRPYGERKDIDILFIGNLNHAAHPERARYLERLAKLSDCYRIVVTAGVTGEEYGRLMSRARIVFNHSIRGEMNLRVFETLACGSVAILEDTNEEVADWLTPGEEIVLYNDDTFEEVVVHLLEHPSEAARIAERGHARAVEFAGENRLDALIDWCMNTPGSGRRFVTLPQEQQWMESLRLASRASGDTFRQAEHDLLECLLQVRPNDACVHAAAAVRWLREYQRDREPQARERCRRALQRTCEAAPDSAPYALNAATVLGAWGWETEEAEYLERALQVHGLNGADELLGHGDDAFYVAWQRAVAEGSATVEMLHAEAVTRLGHLHLQHRRLAESETCLREAERMNPHAGKHLPLLAEALWSGGKRQEAVTVLQQAMERLPMNLEVRERLCAMLAGVGARYEALALAQDTLTIAHACVDRV